MRTLFFVSLLAFSGAAQAQDVRVGTFNTESASDTQPFRVAETIREVGRVDVWAFQEVASRSTAIEFIQAASAVAGRNNFRYIISESGEITSPDRQNDFLAIAYNSTRVRHVETVELHGIRSEPGAGRLGKPSWRLRGGLFARLQDRESGNEFYVDNVHLKCCGGDGIDIRAHQASILQEWVTDADAPVILTGDFNIPVSPSSANGNPDSSAFTTLLTQLDWLRPANPIKTQCSPQFNSMLDHFFMTPNAGITAKGVRVHMTELSYYDLDEQGYSDHRPVTADFDVQ